VNARATNADQANLANFAPKIAMAMSLERLEKESHISNLQPDTYHKVKIW